MGKHHAHIFHTLQDYIDHAVGPKEKYSGGPLKYHKPEFYDRAVRRCAARWKKHIEKHGNVPMRSKCYTCSGKEFRDNIRRGHFKVSTREDQKDLKEILKDS